MTAVVNRAAGVTKTGKLGAQDRLARLLLFQPPPRRRPAYGLLPHAVHDAGHIGFVAHTFFGRPQFSVGRKADGREHLIDKLAKARIGSAFHASGGTF